MKTYFNLMKEMYRSALIFSTAPIASSVNYTFELVTGCTWEEYKAAEKKFKESRFCDPKSTDRAIAANPEMAYKIRAFALADEINAFTHGI